MSFKKKEAYKKEKKEEAQGIFEQGLLLNIHERVKSSKGFGEREKRSLLFLMITGRLQLFLGHLGIEMEQEKLINAVKRIVGDENEFFYFLGDEMYVTIAEAADIFGIKKPRLVTAVNYRHVPAFERIAAFYNYVGRGARKMKHVSLVDVASWLDKRDEQKKRKSYGDRDDGLYKHK